MEILLSLPKRARANPPAFSFGAVVVGSGAAPLAMSEKLNTTGPVRTRDTWGLTTQEKEVERFKDYVDKETLAQSNALFGY